MHKSSSDLHLSGDIGPGVVSNVGTYLGRRLAQIGVREYFAVPGDYNLLLLDQ